MKKCADNPFNDEILPKDPLKGDSYEEEGSTWLGLFGRVKLDW